MDSVIWIYTSSKNYHKRYELKISIFCAKPSEVNYSKYLILLRWKHT